MIIFKIIFEKYKYIFLESNGYLIDISVLTPNGKTVVESWSYYQIVNP